MRDDAARACADVGEDAVGFRVGAEGFEVEVIDGWALRFVECGTRAGNALNVGSIGFSVPYT